MVNYEFILMALISLLGNMSTIYQNVQNFIPTEGSTITAGDSDVGNIIILNPATVLNAVTVILPPNPHLGQQVTIASSNSIAVVTCTGGSTTLSPFALQVNGYASFVYDGVNTCWMITAVNGNPTGITWATQGYSNGVKYSQVFPYFSTATVTAGVATFYLTDNGLSTGNAVFPNNVFANSINLITSDATNQYNYSGFTIAANRKSIAVIVNKIALSLGIIVFTSAANGTSAYLQISGN